MSVINLNTGKMASRRWIFNFYFYCKNESEEIAEMKRHETVLCLKGLLVTKSDFAVVARHDNKEQSCLLLRGHMRLNSPCSQPCAKKMLGRCSKVRPTTCGDVLHLMRHFHTDKQCYVIGELPGPKGTGKGANGVKWVLKTLAEQIDNNYDFKPINAYRRTEVTTA